MHKILQNALFHLRGWEKKETTYRRKNKWINSHINNEEYLFHAGICIIVNWCTIYCCAWQVPNTSGCNCWCRSKFNGFLPTVADDAVRRGTSHISRGLILDPAREVPAIVNYLTIRLFAKLIKSRQVWGAFLVTYFLAQRCYKSIVS